MSIHVDDKILFFLNNFLHIVMFTWDWVMSGWRWSRTSSSIYRNGSLEILIQKSDELIFNECRTSSASVSLEKFSKNKILFAFAFKILFGLNFKLGAVVCALQYNSADSEWKFSKILLKHQTVKLGKWNLSIMKLETKRS